MAITMVFGIAFATFIILFLIPSVILTLEDLKKRDIEHLNSRFSIFYGYELLIK